MIPRPRPKINVAEQLARPLVPAPSLLPNRNDRSESDSDPTSYFFNSLLEFFGNDQIMCSYSPGDTK
jgi:hypothetical protein